MINNVFQWPKPGGSTAATGSDYCTAAEIKTNSELNIPDTASDSDLAIAISAASRSIDQAVGRFFYQTVSQIRYYDAKDEWRIWIDDCVSITELAVDDNGDRAYPTVWTQNTDFELGPWNATSDTGDPEPYQFIQRMPKGRYAFPTDFYKYYAPTYFRQYAQSLTSRCIRITGIFGWPSVPADIHKASMIFAARLYKRGVSPLGVEGTNALGGAQVRTVPLDPDIAMTLNNRRKNWTG